MNASKFSRLYQEHYGKLFFYIVGLCNNRCIAEDVCAKAFSLAWEHRQQLNGNFKSWLYQIATNEMKNTWTRHSYKMMSPLTEDHDEIPDPRNFSEELERFQEFQRASQAACLLNVRLRRALTYHLKGFSIEETAKRLRIPEGSAGQRIHQGKKELRELCPA